MSGFRVAQLAALFAALLPLLASAETKLTLEEAVSTALEKNPVRKAAVFEKRATSADVEQARSALLPQINFAEAYQRGDDPVFVFSGKLRQRRFSSADFALNQLNTPLPFGNLPDEHLLVDASAVADLDVRRVDHRRRTDRHVRPQAQRRRADEAQKAQLGICADLENAVAKGETWTRNSKLNLGPIGSYTGKYTYKYEGQDEKNKDLAKISVETTLTYEPPVDCTVSAIAPACSSVSERIVPRSR